MQEHHIQKPKEKIEIHGYTILTRKKKSALEEGEIYIGYEGTFGTGTHETTRMAVKIMKEKIKEIKPDRLLDVGMGTGIISIIARKEGVPKVMGVEPKIEAIKRAKENMEYNKITEVEYEKDIKGVKEKYPLIIANITSSILSKITKDLLERIEDGGVLYVTGIMNAPYYMKKMVNGWLDNEQKKKYQTKYIKNEEKKSMFCAWEITKIK